jgi:hypothetical protein
MLVEARLAYVRPAKNGGAWPRVAMGKWVSQPAQQRGDLRVLRYFLLPTTALTKEKRR